MLITKFTSSKIKVIDLFFQCPITPSPVDVIVAFLPQLSYLQLYSSIYSRYFAKLFKLERICLFFIHLNSRDRDCTINRQKTLPKISIELEKPRIYEKNS